MERVQNTPPLPTGILYSPQFRSHQEIEVAVLRTQRRHLHVRSHGKIRDGEQSTRSLPYIIELATFLERISAPFA